MSRRASFTLPMFDESPLIDIKPPDLRAYQERTIRLIRVHTCNGIKSILVSAPTRSGKTVIISAIVRTATIPVLFLAHRMELLDQCAEELRRAGLTNIGIIRANDERANPSASVQVASVATLTRRDKPWMGEEIIIIIDEAHLAVADSYRALLECWPNAIIIGFTATPCRLDGKPLKDIFEVLEVAVTYQELLKNPNYLLAPTIFGPPLDDTLLQMRGHDFDEEQSAVVMDKLSGDIVDHWLRRAHMHPVFNAAGARFHMQEVEGPRRRTFLFACNIAHSLSLCARFEKAGARIGHLDGKTPETERRSLVKALAVGELEILSNVNILCLDDQTEILTSSGWVGIDQMTPQHLVGNWENGGRVTFEPPIEIIRRQRARHEKMITLGGERMNVRVTEGHGILYRTRQDTNVFKKKPAIDLVGKVVKLPISGVANPIGTSVDNPTVSAHRRTLRIAVSSCNLRKREGMTYEASRVEAARRVDKRLSLRKKATHELTIDECKLIGFWLGDGWTARLSSGGVEHKISQSEVYPKIIKWLDELFLRTGFHFLRKRHPPPPPNGNIRSENWSVHWSFPRGTGGGPQERVGLYPIEDFLNKGGTDLFYGLSVEQFDALILGFWLADGNHKGGDALSPGRAIVIHNTNKKLIDTLQAIACVRGHSAFIRLATRTKLASRDELCKQIYKLVIGNRNSFHMGNDTFATEGGWKRERVWCVRTRTKNIITRRAGTVLVMGNCEGVNVPEAKCVVHARPTQSLTLWRQSACRILTPWTDPAFGLVRPLILDHAGNTDRLDPPHIDLNWSLTGKPQRRSGGPQLKLCKSCFAYVEVSKTLCPHCGNEFKRGEGIKNRRETDEELQMRSSDPSDVKHQTFHKHLLMAKSKGFKPGFAAAKYKEHYGEWPPREWSTRAKNEFATDKLWQEQLARREKRKAEREAQERAEAEHMDGADTAASEVGVDPYNVRGAWGKKPTEAETIMATWPKQGAHCMQDPSVVGACAGPSACSCECNICLPPDREPERDVFDDSGEFDRVYDDSADPWRQPPEDDIPF